MDGFSLGGRFGPDAKEAIGPHQTLLQDKDVKTIGDFGTQGEYPSHPELLDWLAMKLIVFPL